MRSRAANPPPRSGCFVVLMICEFHLNVIRVRLKGIDSMCHLIRRRIVDVLHSCNRELYFQSDMHKLLQPPIRSTLRTINLVCTFSSRIMTLWVVSKVIQRLQHYLVRPAALVT